MVSDQYELETQQMTSKPCYWKHQSWGSFLNLGPTIFGLVSAFVNATRLDVLRNAFSVTVQLALPLVTPAFQTMWISRTKEG